jgi:hypothetical protein
LIYKKLISSLSEEKDWANTTIAWSNLADSLRLTGKLRDSEIAARKAFLDCQKAQFAIGKAASLQGLGLVLSVSGLVLATRGQLLNSLIVLERSLAVFMSKRFLQKAGVVTGHLAQVLLWDEKYTAAIPIIKCAWE